jgi:small subunit ribosomal protein S16
MLAIRMQRLGRKGHPTYRVVVQDVRQAPTSGKYVAHLGSYDPHTKTSTLVKDKAQFYLDHGAHPSDRVAQLFSAEGIKLPTWVQEPTKHSRATRNPEKLRKNQPAEAATPKTEAEDVQQEDQQKPEVEQTPSPPDGETVAEKPTSSEDTKVDEVDPASEVKENQSAVAVDEAGSEEKSEQKKS